MAYRFPLFLIFFNLALLFVSSITGINIVSDSDYWSSSNTFNQIAGVTALISSFTGLVTFLYTKSLTPSAILFFTGFFWTPAIKAIQVFHEMKIPDGILAMFGTGLFIVFIIGVLQMATSGWGGYE